jgi:hypothetical protein
MLRSEIGYQEHTGTIFHKRTQPTEDLILERNKELRKNPGALRDLSFGRQVASIPFIMYEKAIRDGFAMNSPDAKIASSETMRFLKTTEGAACLVQDPIKRCF